MEIEIPVIDITKIDETVATYKAMGYTIDTIKVRSSSKGNFLVLEKDLKTQYQNAATTEAKLQIIGEMLGLV